MSRVQPDAAGRIMVQVRLPVSLVKRMDHAGVDERMNRAEMIAAALEFWLALDDLDLHEHMRSAAVRPAEDAARAAGC